MTKKPKLFFDMDDTVLRSSDTVIDMINERFGTNKTFDDLRDWKYKSISTQMTGDIINEMYDSDLFFENVAIETEFTKFYNEYNNKTDIFFVSKGHKRNIDNKMAFIAAEFPNATLIPCMFDSAENTNYDKSHIDMRGGIQVDDRFDCLETTNAAVKILITHNKKTKWNYVSRPVENLYIVNTFKEAIEIIEFAINNTDIMLGD